MRKLISIKDLNLATDDAELDQMISMLAGAQQQRIEAKTTKEEGVTRSTALVALAEIDSRIPEALQSAGLDWKGYRDAIGLSGAIAPLDVKDVDLHEGLVNALRLYAEKQGNERALTPASMAVAIAEMVAQEPGYAIIGKRLEEHGAAVAQLPGLLRSLRSAEAPCSSMLVAGVFHPGEDRVRCSGLLISPRHVVTPLSTVEGDSSSAFPPEVEVRLPWMAPGEVLLGSWKRWAATSDDAVAEVNFGSSDLAIITLAVELRVPVSQEVSLANPESHIGDSVEVFAFSSEWSSGGRQGGEVLQALSDLYFLLKLREPLVRGSFGAPVWLQGTGTFLGFVLGGDGRETAAVSTRYLDEATRGLDPAPWWRQEGEEDTKPASSRVRRKSASSWVVSGDPKKNPNINLKSLNAGERLEWQVPEGVRAGDYLFLWVTGGLGVSAVLRCRW